MTLKRKVITTSLAVSLLTGAAASLSVHATPVAPAGLPSSASTLQGYLTQIYNNLTTDDKATIDAARTAIQGLDSTAGASLISPIATIIAAKVNGDPQYTHLDAKSLFKLAQAFTITYDAGLTGLETIRNDPDYRATLDELLKLGGIAGGIDDVDFADLTTFVEDLQSAALTAANGLITKSTSYTDLLAISKLKELGKTTIQSVLAAKHTKTASALASIGITDEAILETKANFEGISADVAKLDGIFLRAYLPIFLSKLVVTTPGGNTNIPVTPGDTSPVGPNTAVANDSVAKAADSLLDIMAQNKGRELATATAAIQKALRQAAVIDMSATITTTGNKAVPTMDTNKLGTLFKTVKELADTANGRLKTSAPQAAPVKVIATLDLGTVAATEVQIPLAQVVLTQAKDNGIETLSLKVNGIALSVDVDQLGSSTIVDFKKQDRSLVPASMTAVSDIYELSFTVDGQSKLAFNKPIEVRFPVESTTGIDTELLVFTKLDGGNLIYKGGMYDAEEKTFVVNNKSFSTYTILENKKNFLDTASVKDWAGHQISVAAAKGILEGRNEGQFVPEGDVTRAEFAKMIVKAFGVENAEATESFTDVADSEWYKPYVAAAAAAGLIEGRADGIFAPDATITRAEMATIAARAMNKIKEYQAVEGEEQVLSIFKDAASIDPTLKSGAAFAAEQGIIIGEDNNHFNPDNTATRAQAAVVIYRLLNK